MSLASSFDLATLALLVGQIRVTFREDAKPLQDVEAALDADERAFGSLRRDQCERDVPFSQLNVPIERVRHGR